MVDLKLEWIASVSGTGDVGLNKLPKPNGTKSRRNPKRLLVEFLFFFFVLFDSNVKIKCQNAFLVIRFSTNQMQIKSNEKNIGEVSSTKKNLVVMGPRV